MKKSVLVVAISLVTLATATSLVFAHGENTSHHPETTLNQVESYQVPRHIVFTETALQENGETITSKYEAWFNEKGEYRMNVTDGPFAGDYEVWDGKTLSQFTKMTNEIIVRPNVKAKPIPHPFLSQMIINRIKEDIDSKTLTLEGTAHILGESGMKYVKKTEIPSEKGAYSHLFMPNRNTKSEVVILSQDGQTVLQSTMLINETVVHELKVEKSEKISSIDSKLFEVDRTGHSTIEMN